MANANLHGLKVAILATDGFEQVELLEPRKALDEAGAQTKVVSPKQGKIKGWNHKEWGNEVSVDASLKSSNPDDFDALLLPGGVMNPDKLRQIPEAVQFAQSFFDAGKPVGAICHGPQLLIETGVVRAISHAAWAGVQIGKPRHRITHSARTAER